MQKRYADPILQYCYENGFDAGKNSPNSDNCNFRFFKTQRKKDAWEKGYEEGKRSK